MTAAKNPCHVLLILVPRDAAIHAVVRCLWDEQLQETDNQQNDFANNIKTTSSRGLQAVRSILLNYALN